MMFMILSNQQKILLNGPFVEDSFDNVTGVDSAKSSNWQYDSEKKIIYPSGGTAIVTSVPAQFATKPTGNVVGVWASTGTVRVYFSADDGVIWDKMENGSPIPIAGDGLVIRVKAEIEVGGTLAGWSAHW